MQSPRGGLRLRFLLSLALVLLTLSALGRVGENRFINYDDKEYVSMNRVVSGGLTREGIAWAFTAFYAGNWHPLTWLSHELDASLFGLQPRGHHLMSLGLHSAAAVLLFLVLAALTGGVWRAALAAALFAVHPLHVESVAWIAERKDVLAGLLGALILAAYVGYVRRPGAARYGLLLLSFALGLMTKPVLVTLPLVLLILDVWPLGRWRGMPTGAGGRSPSALAVEKVPLLILSAASGLVTYLAQQQGGAVGTLMRYPLAVRLANALTAYLGYLWKTVWPLKLALFYPHPGRGLPWWQPAAAGASLLAVTLLVLLGLRRRPWLAAGWLWFLVTLVPMIGLVQVGDQAMADRYTYLPLVGIFLAAAWSLPDRSAAPARRIGAVAGALLAVAVLALLARRQAGYWRDSRTVFEHALAVTRGNYVARVQLGNLLMGEGKLDEALSQYLEAVREEPSLPPTLNNIGNVLMRQDKWEQAETFYLRALALEPGFPPAHYNLGLVRAQQGRRQEAMDQFREALRGQPDFVDALNSLAMALTAEGKPAEALPLLERALRVWPGVPEVQYNAGMALVRLGRLPEAEEHYREAARLNPRDPWARNNLGGVLADTGRLEESAVRFAEAVDLKPDQPRFQLNLGIVLARLGRRDEALRHFQKALHLDPDSAEARQRIQEVLARRGEVEERGAERGPGDVGSGEKGYTTPAP